MRVLLTWELGLNLGHLTRLLPVAQQLKAEEHVVLVAVRGIQAAATVLGPADIQFVQAPHLPEGDTPRSSRHVSQTGDKETKKTWMASEPAHFLSCWGKLVRSLTVAAALAMCCACSHGENDRNTDQGASSPKPAGPHVSVLDKSTLAEPPRTVLDLLNSLKVAWDRKLLVDPTFFEEAQLKRYFNGASVTWKEPPPNMEASWTIRVGTLLLNSEAFPHTVIELRESHHVVKELGLPGSTGYVAGYAQNTGLIEIDVQSLPPVTWGVVKGIFGTGARDIGVEPIWDVAPSPGRYKSNNKARMRYLYPGEDSTILGESDISSAVFLLKQGSQHARPDYSGRISHEPLDGDVVKSIRIYESVK